jgi:hypothetical protein
MSAHNRNRDRRRGRFETAIRIAEPFLNLFLFAGDRIGRVLGSDDPEDIPARMAPEGGSAPRGLRSFHGQRQSR